MTTTILDPIDPTETRVITFLFGDDLGDTATLSGTPTVTPTVNAGADDNPSALLSGSPQIIGAAVLQKVIGRSGSGVTGLVDYHLRATCGTSDGRVLACTAILPLRNL